MRIYDVQKPSRRRGLIPGVWRRRRQEDFQINLSSPVAGYLSPELPTPLVVGPRAVGVATGRKVPGSTKELQVLALQYYSSSSSGGNRFPHTATVSMVQLVFKIGKSNLGWTA